MRKKSRHLQQLMEAMQPIVEANGYHLFDVVWGTSLGRRTLTVYIDKPDGVLLEDCQTLTGTERYVDAADLIKGSYVKQSHRWEQKTLREKADYGILGSLRVRSLLRSHTRGKRSGFRLSTWPDR